MKQIPNMLTLSNLLFGCISIWAASNENFWLAGVCILIGAAADFLDGFVARLLNAQGPMGAQLDSLSDLVTFGVAPGFIALQYFFNHTPFAFVAFIIPICASIRLAKFNLGGQANSFLGIPSPACGMVWAATAIGGLSFLPDNFKFGYLVALIILTSLLMVLPIHVLSFKFKSASWQENKFRYLFLFLALFTIFIFRWASPLIILVLYLICSILDKRIKPTT